MNFFAERLRGSRPLQFTDLRNVQAADDASVSDDGSDVRKANYTQPAIKKSVSSARFGHANLTRKLSDSEFAIRKSALALDLERLQENKENIAQLTRQGSGIAPAMLSSRSSQQDDRFSTSRCTTARSEAPVSARLGPVVQEASYSLPTSRQASYDNLVLESVSSPDSSISMSSARTSGGAPSAPYQGNSLHKDRSWKSDPEVDAVQQGEDGVEEEEEEDMVEFVFSKARHNRVEDLMAALEKGFDINARDKFGNALIHICAQNNNTKLFSMLLKKFPNLNINAKNLKLMTALDYAQKYNFSRLSELLLAKGAMSGTPGESAMRASRFR